MRNAIIFIILVPFHSFGTCIVILKSPEKIYVAADSRSYVTIIKDSVGVIGDTTLSICKIHNVGSTYFAVSGFADKFLTNTATNSLLQFKDINIALKKFEETMKKSYDTIMKFEKRNNITGFNYFLNNSISVVSFFGFINKTPYLISIVFEMRIIDNEIKIYSTIIKDRNFEILGHNKEAFRLSEKDLFKKTVDNRGIIYSLENIVKYEMQFHPDKIAPPIDLLELTAQKPIWIRKKRICN